MSVANLVTFLQSVAARTDLLESLKVLSKDEVIAAAADLGTPFSEAEFDTTIWDLELQMAAGRGEEFDQRFPLWETMWGQYYLEYVVVDMFPSLAELHIDPLAPSDNPTR